MVQAHKFVLKRRFKGLPKVSDFDLVEEELPPLYLGEVLAEALYLSVDPYMRPYTDRMPVGSVMIGGQIAKVIESRNSSYPVGTYVYGAFGWRTHTIFDPNELHDIFIKPSFYVLPSFGDLPLSLGLGLLGLSGISALYGFLDICNPKKDEVVVVSGGAGAVGSVVGQIAKIKGCKVIGIAGSHDKCDWITSELGFDYAINYKTEAVAEVLSKYAPNGVDCYFDNVGGKISSSIINQMRDYGRISVSGAISVYNSSVAEWPLVRQIQPIFISRQLTMSGFLVSRYENKWFDGIAQLKQWFDEGKLKYRETITNGFENMPEAFIDMLQGHNDGKAIVKV